MKKQTEHSILQNSHCLGNLAHVDTSNTDNTANSRWSRVELNQHFQTKLGANRTLNYYITLIMTAE